MNTRVPRQRSLSIQASWWAAPVAFLATLLAMPVNAAITIPDDPLTTGSRVAPNILFILDDSGSMAWRNMNNRDVEEISGPGGFSSTPDRDGITQGTSRTSETTSDSAMYMQNYATNTLYYNPAITYQTWIDADGNRVTGGTSYTSVYSSDQYVGSSGGNKDLSDNTQTYYVPKTPAETNATYLSNVENYYRYQILAGGNDIQRSEYGGIVRTSQTVRINGQNRVNGTASGSWSDPYALAGVSSGLVLEVLIDNTSSGSNSRTLNYRIYDPDGVLVRNSSVSKGNDYTYTVNNTKAGQYTVRVERQHNRTTTFSLSATSYSTNSCTNASSGSGWINCTSATPTGRTVDAEKGNFAIWYSYHRTRIKAAKAGAAEAFKPLGNKVRVGFRTIHNRNNFDIPVTDGNDGRFVNNPDDPNTATNETTTSRTTWYQRLFNAQANLGTPLQSALNSAGAYFSNNSRTGAYGPQSGASQYSCRQNFAILTTDGYWNSGTIDVGTDGDDHDGSEITGGPNVDPYQYFAAEPYSDGHSRTLADVAMKYWKTDLRTDLTNNVPTTTQNPAFWQHMVTFGISIGLKTTKGWSNVDDVPDSNPGWPEPGNDRAANIDDLLHAAYNSRGAFVAASSPSEFAAGLGETLAAISQRTSSHSNVATNAASVRTGGKVFNASYVSGLWTGGVKAWNLDANNEPSTEAWSASIPAHSSRKVFTFSGAGGTSFPTANQIAALERTGGPVNYPVTGSQNADYIKGDSSREEKNGGLLRNRTSVLGDIVGSSPAYVHDTKTLYVGANDGMLHAFNDTGVEVFAYVPSMINFNNLSTLSRGDYSHKYFVDGPVIVSDRSLTPGKNLLVGALGKGGRGLFGLDVTNPAGFAASNVRWELTETPDSNMGLVMARPFLARVKGSTSPAVIVGNGINSASNKAVLLVVNLVTGEVIREIDTGAGSTTTPNGLSAPTGILGPDGRTLAYVYAGDRLGNVWKFDLTNANPESWTSTKLFTAKSNDGAGAAQPITGAVTVATDPTTYKRWVFFGTGSFLTTTEADDKTPLTQSMYGFVDSGSEVLYTDLVKRGMANTGASQDGYPVRTFDERASLPSDKKGWFVNLPGAGERIVQDAQVVANILLTASMIPEGDACEASGSGYINALDAFTGTSAGASFFDLDGDGSTTDTVVGAVPVGSVNFGVGMPTLPVILDGRLIVGGSGGGGGGAEKPGAGGIVQKTWGKVSWREIRSD